MNTKYLIVNNYPETGLFGFLLQLCFNIQPKKRYFIRRDAKTKALVWGTAKQGLKFACARDAHRYSALEIGGWGESGFTDYPVEGIDFGLPPQRRAEA